MSAAAAAAGAATAGAATAEVFDLATGTLRELNQRLHDLTPETAQVLLAHPAIRAALTRWRPGSTRRYGSRSKGMSAITAPA